MKLSHVMAGLTALVLLLSGTLLSQTGVPPMPRMVSVEPTTGKAGDELVVTGENLEKPNVAELYLTDGKNDLKVQITEQTATNIKFKIPAEAKAGRFALMVLIKQKGSDPKLIEQPVKVTVE